MSSTCIARIVCPHQCLQSRLQTGILQVGGTGHHLTNIQFDTTGVLHGGRNHVRGCDRTILIDGVCVVECAYIIVATQRIAKRYCCNIMFGYVPELI